MKLAIASNFVRKKIVPLIFGIKISFKSVEWKAADKLFTCFYTNANGNKE